MTEKQVENLKLGIMPIDAQSILLIESAFNWINDNTTLVINCDNDEELNKLSPNVRLFILKYVDLMALPTGIASESIEGLSQSYNTTNKSDLIWQYATELLGKYLKSQMTFTCSKSRWKYGR